VGSARNGPFDPSYWANGVVWLKLPADSAEYRRIVKALKTAEI